MISIKPAPWPQPPAGRSRLLVFCARQYYITHNATVARKLTAVQQAGIGFIIHQQSEQMSTSATPLPKKMAKQKVNAENRGFQARWEAEYMFTEVKGKPVCLLCGESVAVMKEYNLRRHRETSKKHTEKDKNMDTEQRLKKVEELKQGLKARQALFSKAQSQSEAAVKASFIVAEEVARRGQKTRPFTEGEFIKKLCA